MGTGDRSIHEVLGDREVSARDKIIAIYRHNETMVQNASSLNQAGMLSLLDLIITGSEGTHCSTVVQEIRRYVVQVPQINAEGFRNKLEATIQTYF